ncbi:hypothetical protein G9A89_023090 [Geosiphon pyriformis]|nr:hypothetical protein G9A89_023090 [Geosiphon pyriformis]
MKNFQTLWWYLLFLILAYVLSGSLVNPATGKIPITDEKFRDMLANNAFHASQAACIKNEQKKLSPEIHMEIPKDSSPQQIIWTLSYKEETSIWLGKKSILVPYPHVPGGLVDEKDFKSWLKAQERFLSIIKKVLLKPNFYNMRHLFTFNGFGTGGVYAVYAALIFAVTYHTLPIVITFGKPRMGNMEFAQFVETQIIHYRVTYRDDSTPSFPEVGFSSVSNQKFNFIPLSREYWIPYQDQCECSSESVEKDRTKVVFVYECFSKRSLKPHRYCNAGWRKRIDKRIRLGMRRISEREQVIKMRQNFDHFGPYFGYIMGQCPV